MRRLSGYAHKELITVAETASIAEAARVMARSNIGAVAVTAAGDAGRVQGLVTEREIARRIAGQGLSAETPVSRILDTEATPRCSPELTLDEGSALMRKCGSRYLFLVDAESPDRVIGIISMQDLILGLAEECRTEAEMLKRYISGEP